MNETTPPPLLGPSSKEKRYDRQLRLWAASGQAALEEAHVVLVNSGCGVVGIETLKNLVLPGIGHYTVIDSEKVTEQDLGVNFFLDKNSIGESRAKICCELLRELNPDVRGDHTADSLDHHLNALGSGLLKSATLIILTAPIVSSTTKSISIFAEHNSIPLLFLHSIGFYSSFSISLPSAFPIVDTHPDPTSTTDLRLLDPWPELSALVKEKTDRLETLSDHDHGHIPYVVLLLNYLGKWREAHNGNNPGNYKEKTEFRSFVAEGARRDNAEGGEENYDEAIAAVLKSLNPSSLSSAVREVFESEECRNLRPDSPSFWIITSAIAEFYSQHECLPLSGSLPDMKAQSADYIRLQHTYKDKARKDYTEVLKKVRAKERTLDQQAPYLDQGPPKSSGSSGRSHLAQSRNAIEEKEVEAFCKGAGFVKLIRGKPIQVPDENGKVTWDKTGKSARQELSDPESLLPLHIVILAYDIFCNESTSRSQSRPEGRPFTPPGLSPINVESDTSTLTELAKGICKDLFAEAGTDILHEVEYNDDYAGLWDRFSQLAAEIVRAGGSELHNISALTGGMAAQEVIKVITKQYVPVNNTCLFDGIKSKSQVVNV
ncbi:MAG: hypothetical protein M4579_003663 [Chaenotheca gracillima]|nr:MAG: hypothetical protein M4579_003663 [Chaenotheca gracillima]